jgi:hypothetical protein
MGGAACPPLQHRSRRCDDTPEAVCELIWPELWSPCTVSCGGGHKYQTQQLVGDPHACSQLIPETRALPCNTQPCSTATDSPASRPPLRVASAKPSESIKREL